MLVWSNLAPRVQTRLRLELREIARCIGRTPFYAGRRLSPGLMASLPSITTPCRFFSENLRILGKTVVTQPPPPPPPPPPQLSSRPAMLPKHKKLKLPIYLPVYVCPLTTLRCRFNCCCCHHGVLTAVAALFLPFSSSNTPDSTRFPRARYSSRFVVVILLQTAPDSLAPASSAIKLTAAECT